MARSIPDYPAARVPRQVLAKGNYFSYAGRPVFSRLIYPTPMPGGLGVHVTLDLAGRMRFGPDVEWIEREYYAVDPARAATFYSRIRTYWPGLRDGTLSPDYSGIRPKLSGPGEPQGGNHAGRRAHCGRRGASALWLLRPQAVRGRAGEQPGHVRRQPGRSQLHL